MLSILGRIGHLLHHPGCYEDQLYVIYTGPNRSFIAPSRFLCLPCTMRKIDKNMCKYRVILIIPFKMYGIPHSRHRGSIKLV